MEKSEVNLQASSISPESLEIIDYHIQRIRENLKAKENFSFKFLEDEMSAGELEIVNNKINFSINNPFYATHFKNHPDWELLRILRIASHGNMELEVIEAEIKNSIKQHIAKFLQKIFPKSA